MVPVLLGAVLCCAGLAGLAGRMGRGRLGALQTRMDDADHRCYRSQVYQCNVVEVKTFPIVFWELLMPDVTI